jgi:hypothetical protein
LTTVQCGRTESLSRPKFRPQIPNGRAAQHGQTHLNERFQQV